MHTKQRFHNHIPFLTSSGVDALFEIACKVLLFIEYFGTLKLNSYINGEGSY